MTTRACLSVDPEALLGVRRDLLREALALDAVEVVPPDTGPTSALTAAALDRVATTVTGAVEDLHGLADALHRLVADLADQDGQVTAGFDLLRMRSVS